MRIILLTLFLAVSAYSVPVLESIQEIKQLSNAEAEKWYPASISGQVLHLHSDLQRIYIYDGETVLYAQLFLLPRYVKGLQVGSEVQLKGKTMAGGFSPIIICDEVAVTGWKPLPEAKKISVPEYQIPVADTEWVEVTGRPVAVERVPVLLSNYQVVSIEVFGSVQDVYIPSGGDIRKKLEPLMFREVRVKGVMGTRANAQHQMIGRTLFVNSIDDFELLPVQDTADPELVPIHDLMRHGKLNPGLLKTRGTLLYFTATELYLQGEQNCLRADILEHAGFEPGDIIELTGYAVPEPPSPFFRAVAAEKAGKQSPPEPRPLMFESGSINTDWHNSLVSIEAEYLYSGKSSLSRHDHKELLKSDVQQESLWCRVAPRLFEARLPAGVVMPSALRPGSTVRLTGIFHSVHSKDPQVAMVVESFWIELPGTESVEIIEQPSWWTARRLMWGLLIAALVMFLFLIWILALRKTVIRQTRTIGQQIERETVLNERQRIARELHDTLEQGLTALSFQLERISNKVRQKTPVELPVVEEAEDILETCRNESRASIQDLREGLLEKMDLPSAIPEVLKPQLAGTDIKLKVKVTGSPRRLPLFLEHQLMRIIAESARNAIQHASPSNIKIILNYGVESLQVIVQDDGCGFDTEILDHTERYGVQGMKERALRISGTLTIESEVGTGTAVTLVLPNEEHTDK